MAASTTAKTDYNVVMRNVSDQAYREVSEFIWKELSSVSSFDGGYTYYTLNRDGEQIIRMHSRRKSIEISDKVDPQIVKSIRDMIKTEIREADSAR
ncbi:hypothetical protein HYS50_03310 [Candidatus Woesearchaeota archaeon]|nr:hypothetical protein [Candidatus Woesearchaeota archaeon]